jgi:hypothetical protein
MTIHRGQPNANKELLPMSYKIPPADEIPDLPLQRPGQRPLLPKEMDGEPLVLLALLEKCLTGITRRCPHPKCMRLNTCCNYKDICAAAPLDPETRLWLADRVVLPTLKELREEKEECVYTEESMAFQRQRLQEELGVALEVRPLKQPRQGKRRRKRR